MPECPIEVAGNAREPLSKRRIEFLYKYRALEDEQEHYNKVIPHEIELKDLNELACC